MDDSLLRILAVVFGFLLGSIPFGVLFARVRGVDLQREGSGNTGATNVARSVGKKLGVVVLVLDALKGAVPMLLVQWRFEADQTLLTATALATVVAHCHSPWLWFRGGKGVATTLGVLLVVDPELALLAVICFALVYGRWGLVSLGSLVAAWVMVAAVLLSDRVLAPPLLVLLLSALVTIEHRSNLRRLFAGTESRV